VKPPSGCGGRHRDSARVLVEDHHEPGRRHDAVEVSDLCASRYLAGLSGELPARPGPIAGLDRFQAWLLRDHRW
jgi:hypothetical protein